MVFNSWGLGLSPVRWGALTVEAYTRRQTVGANKATQSCLPSVIILFDVSTAYMRHAMTYAHAMCQPYYIRSWFFMTFLCTLHVHSWQSCLSAWVAFKCPATCQIFVSECIPECRAFFSCNLPIIFLCLHYALCILSIQHVNPGRCLMALYHAIWI